MDYKAKISHLVSLYCECAAVPTVKWGNILKTPNGEICVQAVWSSYYAAQQEKANFRTVFRSSTTGPTFAFSRVGFPVECSTEKLVAVSPSQKFTCTLRKFTDKKGDKQQALEIWTSDALWKSWDLEALSAHGDVNVDAQFGCLQWSPDESNIVYVAEKKQPTSVSFFSQKPVEPSDTDSDHDSIKKELGIGQYRQDWGEQLVGKHHPVACIFNISTSQITEINLDNKSCGQVIWGPQGESLICVGWDEEPWRLGLKFCTNRKSALFHVDLKNDNTVSLLHDRDGQSYISPCLSPDGQTLVFLEVPDRGPHRSCSRLYKMDMTTKNVTLVVDVVDSAKTGEFPGIYCERLNSNCFSSDSQFVFLTSPWRSKMEILCVCLKSGVVSRVTNDPDIGSWKLLDLVDNFALAACSAPNLKPYLMFSNLNDYLVKPGSPVWLPVQDADPKISDILWKILDFQPKDCDNEDSLFQAVLVTPTRVFGQKYPLLVVPHGGPHSVIDAGFYLSSAFFVKLNFAVLFVNYRGSLGFGNKVLRSLLGRIGKADVNDVQQCVEFMQTNDWVDSKRIALFGGSHGGFLSAQLVGQFPETYGACVCRNPVTDVSGKLEGTDIPDWGFAESGQQEKFGFSTLPEPEIRKIMWECSPYQYIKNVKTPILMLIGQNDLRVPPSQGINYYHTLKALGKPCQMYVYNDDHSLSSGKVESDSLVRSALWIIQHLEI